MYLMRWFKLLIYFFWLVPVVPVASQPIGTWLSYTAQSTVLEILQSEDLGLWAATEGGLFSVQDGEIRKSVTPTEGMYRINPQTLYFDERSGFLWLGFSDGLFESFDPSEIRFDSYSDIARATRFSPRGINRFVMSDDDLLIATDFGLVLFDPVREITIDTYSNLGTFPSGSRVNDAVISNGRIFAATADGVAISRSDAADLVPPDSWISYGAGEGFGSNVSALVVFQGKVHARMGDAILRYEGGHWQATGLFSDAAFTRLSVSKDGEYLVAWNDRRIWLWPSPDAIPQPDTGPDAPITSVLVDETSRQVFLGIANQGILVYSLQTGEWLDQYLPPGPYMNSFSDVHVRDGILVSGSNNLRERRGIGTSQSGYYIYREGEWFNFHNRTDSILQHHNFNSVFTTASTRDYFYFGSWGRGVVQHHRQTDDIRLWNAGNSALRGIPANPNYIVVNGMASDRNDCLWLISKRNVTQPLYRFDPQTEEWTGFHRLPGLAANDLYRNVTVDSNGQLWIALETDRDDGRGLVVKRVEGDELGDGVVIRDEAGRGNLPHPLVNVVVQDRRGEIWVGTERGLARFVFPQRVIDGSPSDRQASLLINADETADSPFLLRTSNVTSIAVNSANQKWVGTDGEGVWLIRDEGGRHRAIRHFTAENSPLISNSVSSIAYDEMTGQVFIATDRGLISYTDVVRGSVEKMEDLFVYPNPFSYRDEPVERVVIDRLSEQTTLRILTVDGRLVRRLETTGGRVEWDVRDFRGERLSSGVYLIVASDTQNDRRGIGKIVIIR